MITTGKYRSFYKYLAERYADTVVLTFGQIEDLLGFALPASARVDGAWWTNAPEDAGQRVPVLQIRSGEHDEQDAVRLDILAL